MIETSPQGSDALEVIDMADGTKTPITALPAHPGGPFKPGHPRYGGRKPGATGRRIRYAQDIAATMKVDPVHFMLLILNSDTLEVPEVDEQGNVILGADGQPKRKTIAIPIDMRMDAAKNVAPYVHPRLQTTALTGKDGGPITTATLDVAALIANPEMAAAAEKLALQVTRQKMLTQGENHGADSDD